MAIAKAIAKELLRDPETGAEIEEAIDQHIIRKASGLFVPDLQTCRVSRPWG